MEAVDPHWRKSSYSGNGGDCAEVAATDRVLVRDSKDQTGPVLAFSTASWRRFVGRVRASLGRAERTPRSL